MIQMKTLFNYDSNENDHKELACEFLSCSVNVSLNI